MCNGECKQVVRSQSCSEIFPCKKYLLEDGAEIIYVPNFIQNNISQQIFRELRSALPDNVKSTISIKSCEINNKVCTCVPKCKEFKLLNSREHIHHRVGDNIRATYKLADSIFWTPLLKKLKIRIEDYARKKFKFATLNLYKNGDDYVNFRTYDDLLPSDIVAIFTLGIKRKFIIKHKKYTGKRNGKSTSIILENGSLLILNNPAAKLYKNSVPRQPDTKVSIIVTLTPH